jgi:hypothetical protein
MTTESRRTPTSAEAIPWTWLQPPTISIGAEVNGVGESHYQGALGVVAGGRTPFGPRTRLLTAALAREPDNPYDAGAVRIEVGGATIAYLPRDDAPRFHSLLDRLSRAGVPATCRALLTGGWDQGHGDRGAIGIKVLTGRRPAKWAGGGGFLPAIPWHEQHVIPLDPGRFGISGLASRPVVTLADADHRGVAVLIAGAIVGKIPGRPDLSTFVSRVKAAGLPATVQARTVDDQLIVEFADPDAVVAALDRLGTGDLRTIRCSVQPTGWWICQRCHRIWNSPQRPPRHWYDIEDEDSGSPHICPQCWSYAFTHPF